MSELDKLKAEVEALKQHAKPMWKQYRYYIIGGALFVLFLLVLGGAHG